MPDQCESSELLHRFASDVLFPSLSVLHSHWLLLFSRVADISGRRPGHIGEPLVSRIVPVPSCEH